MLCPLASALEVCVYPETKADIEANFKFLSGSGGFDQANYHAFYEKMLIEPLLPCPHVHLAIFILVKLRLRKSVWQ
jgi:hypothetical protein